MDDHFTTKADSLYIASVSQEKKIIYLERELKNSEAYNQTLEKSLESIKSTVDKVVADLSNRQILTAMTESIYKF